eukprot:GHVT01071989.1.p2 GENE.GHVT01071989.1~~GHVT01071989.1.p2  ORF type:complete len:119 (+),score=11.31 GHVT01071989.1:1000-1356(+)
MSIMIAYYRMSWGPIVEKYLLNRVYVQNDQDDAKAERKALKERRRAAHAERKRRLAELEKPKIEEPKKKVEQSVALTLFSALTGKFALNKHTKLCKTPTDVAITQCVYRSARTQGHRG